MHLNCINDGTWSPIEMSPESWIQLPQGMLTTEGLYVWIGSLPGEPFQQLVKHIPHVCRS